jgi:hypothetical protein
MRYDGKSCGKTRHVQPLRVTHNINSKAALRISRLPCLDGRRMGASPG